MKRVSSPATEDGGGLLRRMRRLRLSTLLIVFNLAMILVAIGLVGAGGVTLLGRLADEQALARVRLAGLSAAEAIERTGHRLRTSAQLLAERPTLARLLASGDAEGMRGFLDSFRRTSELSGMAVTRDGRLIASSGPALPWQEMEKTVGEDGAPEYLEGGGAAPFTMLFRAGVPGVPGASVLVARVLDEDYAEGTGHKVGFPVSLLTRADLEGAAGEPLSALRQQALREGGPASGRTEDPGPYTAVVPLRDHAGEIIGAVEASLPAPVVDAPLRNLAGTLLALTLGIGIVAVFFSLMLARRLAGPLERLTEAASRIGRGELTSPIPPAAGSETATLSAAMEEMRARILELMTELRRQQAEAEAILEGITEGVFAVDRERRIRYLNHQAAEMLNVGPEEAVGRFCGDILNPQEGTDGLRPCDDKCPILHARFRGSSHAREHLLLPGGGQRSVVITSAPPDAEAEQGDAGEIHQFQVLRDETELEASRHLRDTVLANISHEFRSPLSAQLASLELLRDQLPDLSREEVQELILSLERGTLRLTRLIDNLLESTRIEAGQSALRRGLVALDEAVEEAAELMGPLIQQRGQQLETNLPFPMPKVPGDGPRLTQVFVNLLANANKFGPAGSNIRVGGEVREREIELWVEDEGPGLPPGAPEAIFTRYARSPREEPSETGMGLGLWIVKSIMERHGGRVEAESRDKGTRMRVTLPREIGNEDTRR